MVVPRKAAFLLFLSYHQAQISRRLTSAFFDEQITDRPEQRNSGRIDDSGLTHGERGGGPGAVAGLQEVQTEGGLACTVVVPTLGMSLEAETHSAQFSGCLNFLTWHINLLRHLSKYHMWVASAREMCLSFYNPGGAEGQDKGVGHFGSPEASPWL